MDDGLQALRRRLASDPFDTETARQLAREEARLRPSSPGTFRLAAPMAIVPDVPEPDQPAMPQTAHPLVFDHGEVWKPHTQAKYIADLTAVVSGYVHLELEVVDENGRSTKSNRTVQTTGEEVVDLRGLSMMDPLCGSVRAWASTRRDSTGGRVLSAMLTVRPS